MSRWSNLTRGIIKENPVLVLVLGTCPTLAVSTQASNAIGMGIAATAVLLCSNIAISLLRKAIPDKVRIPSYIVLIAGFVTIVQMVVEAFSYSLYEALGIYLPLIVVNCIILGRAEMYANKNKVVDSALDALGMGIGFTLTLLVMASIRGDLRQRHLVRHGDPRSGAEQYFDLYAGPRRLRRVRPAHRPGQQDHQGQGRQENGIRLRRLPVGHRLRQALL